MSNVPYASVRPDDDTVDIIGHGGIVPMTITETREIVEQLVEILSAFDSDQGQPRCSACGAAVYLWPATDGSMTWFHVVPNRCTKPRPAGADEGRSS